MYDPDEPLTFTPNGIPTSLRPYLQEYTLEKLDPVSGEHVLIERSLEYGGRRELRWLFKQYGRKRIAGWVRDFGHSFLDPIDFTYWSVVLEVDEYRIRSENSAWRDRWTFIGK